MKLFLLVKKLNSVKIYLVVILFFVAGLVPIKALAVQVAFSFVAPTINPASLCENNNIMLQGRAFADSDFGGDRTHCIIWRFEMYKDGVNYSPPVYEMIDNQYNFILNEAGSYRIRATAWGGLGCPFGTTFGQHADRYIRIGLTGTPGPFIFPDLSSKFCYGETRSISVPTVNGATSYTWEVPPTWKVDGIFGPVVSGRSNTVNITAPAVGGGGSNIRVKGVSTCGPSLNQSSTVFLPEYPVIFGQSEVCPNFQYFYSAPNGSNYSWAVNGVQIQGPNNEQHVNLYTNFNFTYGYIEVNFIDECNKPQYLYKYISLSSQDCYSVFTSYPNPSTSSFEVERMQIGEGEGEEYEVKLYDNFQTLVKEAKTKQKKIKIDTKGLPKGIYYLHIISKNKLEKRQHIIQ